MKTKILYTNLLALHRGAIIHSTNTLPSPRYLYCTKMSLNACPPSRPPFSSTYTPISKARYFSCRWPTYPSLYPPLSKLLTHSIPKHFPKVGGKQGEGMKVLRFTLSCQRVGPGTHAQREQSGPEAKWARGLQSTPAGNAGWEGPARPWVGSVRGDSVACGSVGHTHNFSIHSPSKTSVQLEAVMGSTMLCSAGREACSGRASPSVSAVTQAARSTISSGLQRPPAILGRGVRLLHRTCGEK